MLTVWDSEAAEAQFTSPIPLARAKTIRSCSRSLLNGTFSLRNISQNDLESRMFPYMLVCVAFNSPYVFGVE